MLIQINILIPDIVLDFIIIHFFHIQILTGVKTLFSEKVHQCTLIIRKKDILVLGEGPTQG